MEMLAWLQGAAARSKAPIFFLLLAIGLPLSVQAASAAEKAAEIEYGNDRVSAEFHNTPTELVFRELDRVADVRIHAPKSLTSRRLTITLSDVSVKDALRQIFQTLSVSNYAVMSGPGREGRTTVVVLDSLDLGGEVISLKEEQDSSEEAPDVVSFSDTFVSGAITGDSPSSENVATTGLVAND